MLNKYLFGLLVNTIAIFSSISSAVVATEGLHKCRNQLNQIAWDMDCSCREFVIGRDRITKSNTFKDYYWILDQEYEESRTKVIGEAIGDCVAGKNEFAKKGPNDIITFDETEPKDYELEHWNAVILYNYIHEAINGKGQPYYDESDYADKLSDVQTFLKKKLKLLKAHYENQYNGAIDNAVKEIQEYVKALKLNEELYEFRQSKLQYDSDQDIKYIAPYVDQDNSDDEKLKFDECFRKFNKDLAPDEQQYIPTFRYYNGNLFIAKLEIQADNWHEDTHYAQGYWMIYPVLSSNSIDEIKKHGDWLLKRLNELVKLPTEALWNKWYQKKKK